MGRRQVVESVNSALKGAFVDLGPGSFRVFGQVKVTALLGFTVAGFNLDRIRGFGAKQSIDSSDSSTTPRRIRRQRAKRRIGVWAELVDPRSHQPPDSRA